MTLFGFGISKKKPFIPIADTLTICGLPVQAANEHFSACHIRQHPYKPLHIHDLKKSRVPAKVAGRKLVAGPLPQSQNGARVLGRRYSISRVWSRASNGRSDTIVKNGRGCRDLDSVGDAYHIVSVILAKYADFGHWTTTLDRAGRGSAESTCINVQTGG